MKLMNLILYATAAVLLSGCCSRVNPDSNAGMFPDLPDNAYCFRKIQEYKDFAGSPQNAKSEAGFSVVTPPFVPEPYLAVLKERGAVLSSTVLLNSLQTKKLLKLNPPEVLFWSGPHLDGGLSPVTLYYLPENQQKISELLTEITQTMTRPVYWDSIDFERFLKDPNYQPENPSEVMKNGWYSAGERNNYKELYNLLCKRYGSERFSNGFHNDSDPTFSMWCAPKDQMVIFLFKYGQNNETVFLVAPYREEYLPESKK